MLQRFALMLLATSAFGLPAAAQNAGIGQPDAFL